jgi:polar amino acid transport system substrate-binding protein
VPEKVGVDILLSRELKNTVVVLGPGLPGALELVRSGRADVLASTKSNLFQMSDQLPNSRVLAGHYATDPLATAVPKGRDTGVGYARKFIEDTKSLPAAVSCIALCRTRSELIRCTSTSMPLYFF